MSTRCNIKVVDGNSTQWFYRHSDGYPEGTLGVLNRFMDLLKEGKIRANVSQGGSWLILLGADEYGQNTLKLEMEDPNHTNWKVGSIELTDREHGDIEYLYTIDLKEKLLFYYKLDEGITRVVRDLKEEARKEEEYKANGLW